MSDTFFTSSPHWGVYIVLYFFVGGIAGGAAFLAGLLHLFGRPEDRPTVRAGYYAAFAGTLLSGLLLTLDLGRPFRFWHMLLQSNRWIPIFKPWSPMSVGAWGLVLFGGVSLLGALGAYGEQQGRRRAMQLSRGGLGGAIAVLSIGLGLFLAGYTGVLLAVTNRPIWADSTWLGALFLASGVSTAAATLMLTGPAEATERWLTAVDRRVLVLELLALALFLASLGAVARLWVSLPGLGLLVGVVGAGIVAPWLLEGGGALGRSGGQPAARPVLAAVLVLLGGLLLRIAVIAASDQVVARASRVAGP